ncbi:MAG: glucokinase [Hyphomicrobiales bacterium]|nr:glucokinase [Hyphomicrobiales bacterium]
MDMNEARAYLSGIDRQNSEFRPPQRRVERRLDFPHPLIVCDVGGTNVRVGFVEAPGDEVRRLGNASTDSHSSFVATIKAMQERTKTRVRSLVVSAAGPARGAVIRMTNADWTLDGAQMAQTLALEQGLLLNDFEAQAIALPHLAAAWTRTIGSGRASAPAPQLVLGPGTGLGAAALLKAGEKWLPVVTEAGHMSFGPADGEEERVWTHLERAHGRVTFESVLSGPGLARLHAAMRAARGLPPTLRAAPEIAPAAAGGDEVAIATIRLFWRLVARCAGDLALAYLARGGVTLAGGVLPRLVDWLDPQAFREAFEARAPMDALAREIPTRLLIETDAALTGMAALAATPSAYAIDYGDRAWRPSSRAT